MERSWRVKLVSKFRVPGVLATGWVSASCLNSHGDLSLLQLPIVLLIGFSMLFMSLILPSSKSGFQLASFPASYFQTVSQGFS